MQCENTAAMINKWIRNKMFAENYLRSVVHNSFTGHYVNDKETNWQTDSGGPKTVILIWSYSKIKLWLVWLFTRFISLWWVHLSTHKQADVANMAKWTVDKKMTGNSLFFPLILFICHFILLSSLYSPDG